MQKRINQMGPRGPHAIFPPDHLFVNERRGEIIVVHALPPPVFTTSLLMNTGVSYNYIYHTLGAITIAETVHL